MYYNRKLTDSFSKLLEPKGELRWLFHFVKEHHDLDFLIGKNDSKEWISIYRGLSRVLTILKTRKPDVVKLDGADAYKKISNDLYGEKKISENFSEKLEDLVKVVSDNPKFNRYYNNKKEGYFQNELSRKFGICGKENGDFVIIDKEAVIGGYKEEEKDEIYGKIRKCYKELQKGLSQKDAKRFGKDLDKKAIGKELDFLALDKQGNLLLIEYKHGTNTSGIYLSPLQIGMHFELFNRLPREELEQAVLEMLEQKKKIGLINPKWNSPNNIKDIVPVLIISKYNTRSSAKIKFWEVMGFVRAKKGDSFLANIKTYNYTTENGIKVW